MGRRLTSLRALGAVTLFLVAPDLLVGAGCRSSASSARKAVDDDDAAVDASLANAAWTPPRLGLAFPQPTCSTQGVVTATNNQFDINCAQGAIGQCGGWIDAGGGVAEFTGVACGTPLDASASGPTLLATDGGAAGVYAIPSYATAWDSGGSAITLPNNQTCLLAPGTTNVFVCSEPLASAVNANSVWTTVGQIYVPTNYGLLIDGTHLFIVDFSFDAGGVPAISGNVLKCDLELVATNAANANLVITPQAGGSPSSTCVPLACIAGTGNNGADAGPDSGSGTQSGNYAFQACQADGGGSAQVIQLQVQENDAGYGLARVVGGMQWQLVGHP